MELIYFYKKQPIWVFVPYIFLIIFSWYPFAWTSSTRKDHFWKYWQWRFSFLRRRTFSCSEEFNTRAMVRIRKRAFHENLCCWHFWKFVWPKKWNTLHLGIGISISISNCYLSILMPKRFYQRNDFDDRLFSFTKSAVLFHFESRRFCLILKNGVFVSLLKSAALSHLKSAVLSCSPKISNKKGNFSSRAKTATMRMID